MSTQRSVVTVVALVLVVGLLGELGGGGAPALAASPSLTIPISGQVTLSSDVTLSPDTVTLMGLANISSDLLPGDATTPPTVLLSIGLLSGGGTGLGGTKYLIIAETQRVRFLNPSDAVEITVPVYPLVPGGINKAQSALASFSLSLTPTGQLNSVIGKLATPHFE